MGEGGVLHQLSDGWWYYPATTVLPVTWQATLKPYKHQINDLAFQSTPPRAVFYPYWQKDKFQITRFLRFASQITRRTIFSCLARFPSNQFTQSPTIHVSAYPVAKICHVRLPGRPNFSSRLPGNDIFLLSSNFIKKLRTSLPSLPQFTFQLPRPLTFLMSDYPVGQISRPDYPAANFSL